MNRTMLKHLYDTQTSWTVQCCDKNGTGSMSLSAGCCTTLLLAGFIYWRCLVCCAWLAKQPLRHLFSEKQQRYLKQLLASNVGRIVLTSEGSFKNGQRKECTKDERIKRNSEKRKASKCCIASWHLRLGLVMDETETSKAFQVHSAMPKKWCTHSRPGTTPFCVGYELRL